MIQTLIGRKIDQTQKFLENGKRVPVTVISVGDNAVVQVKTTAKDTYAAVQLGFGTRKRANQALRGHSKKAGLEKAAVLLREVRVLADDEANLPQVGEMITVDTVFKPGDIVDVTGTSKGKGFAGVVKRHNFRGGPKTHGQSDRERAPGSIGQTTTPGRVYKGKRMAGHMGVAITTIKNLTVVSVDNENKILYVDGLVPGHKDAIVTIKKTGEEKHFVPLMEDALKAKAAAASNAVEAEVSEDATSNVAAANVAAEEKAEEKTEEVKAVNIK